MKTSRRDFLKSTLALGSATLINGCPAMGKVVVRGDYKTDYNDNEGNKQIDVKVWYPLSGEKIKYPIVALSHGLTASPWMYDTLARKLAENDYVVVAPHHKDYLTLLGEENIVEMEGDRFFKDINNILTQLHKVQGYESYSLIDMIYLITETGASGDINNDQVLDIFNKNFIPRVNELEASFNLLGKINSDPKEDLYNSLDLDNINGLSHSFGGNTILQKIITNSPFYDSRIKSSVFMSPSSGFSDINKVNSPTMWATGTIDGERLKKRTYDSFELSPHSSEYINFKEFGHLTFSQDICKFYKAFFDLLNTIVGENPNIEKVFQLEDNRITENIVEKGKALDSSIVCFFDYWAKSKGKANDFLKEYGEFVEAYKEK